MKKWFEWERQATIHSLMLCLESWGDPTRTYCGRAWPTSFIKYTGDVVLWVNRFDELFAYGEFALDRYLEPNNHATLKKDITRIARTFEEQFVEIKSTDLKKIPDRNLLEIYQMIAQTFMDWFVPSAFVEPVGLAGEKRVRELLTKKGIEEAKHDEYVSVITTTPQKTFSKKELEGLALCVEGKKSFEEHAKNWYWIHNNYYSTEKLDSIFFKGQVQSLAKKHGDLSSHVKRLDEEFKGILKKKEEYVHSLMLNRKELSLIRLLEFFAWYQDYRKEYTMRSLHYLDIVLGEIGRRKGLSLAQMKCSMRSEIPRILAGTFETKLLDARHHGFLAVWDLENNQFSTYTYDAEDAWKRIDPHITHAQEQIEISGKPASRGIVRGYARVTMNARDAHELKAGEVLVTSMTTPDFVTAMKKASAVVTNEGGILCHAAVISREFGIPCVVGTQIATKAIRTGDLIEVDGDRGIVRKV